MSNVQYLADHIGIFEGAEMPTELDMELPCSICESPVYMLSSIDFEEEHEDGSTSTQRMTEGQARQLMGAIGIVPPPVLCQDCGKYA